MFSEILSANNIILLLETGANIDARNNDNVLILANYEGCDEGSYEVYKLLLKSGAKNIKVRDKDDKSVIICKKVYNW